MFYTIAGAITRGDIFVRGAIKEHMASLVYKLEEMGVELDYVTTLCPFAVNNNAIICDCISVGNPGCGNVLMSTGSNV
jgi:UDP-N-acetylglucosamine enolpyruvyl transferase